MENQIKTGFHTVSISADYNINIKRGKVFKCNSAFQIKEGILSIKNNDGSVDLVLPDVKIDKLSARTENGSIRARDVCSKEYLFKADLNVEIKTVSFEKIDISSENGSVIIKYKGTGEVYADCHSENGTIKTKGPFYGTEECERKIIVNADFNITLSA
jgi:DUF4097 and DUF4098 domain-containing protein YvlB